MQYDVLCQVYRVALLFNGQTIVIPEIDLYNRNIEEAITNATLRAAADLDSIDVIDVEFRVEREGLPGPPAL